MTGVVVRTTSLVVAASLALLVSGCGAGGFKSEQPVRDTAIHSYVALGDGFAAAPYVGKTTTKDGCLRGSGNYPAQVAEALEVEVLRDVTCVGATTKSLTSQTKPPGTSAKVAAQIAFVKRDTDLITLGAGIEDEGMLNALFRVCLQLPCVDRVPPPDLQDRVNTIEDSLIEVVRKLQEKAPTAYIVIVGYPQLMPARDTCAGLPKLNPFELDAAYFVLQKVNQAVRSAAQQTGSTFIDVARLTSDHHICSDDPWVHDKKSVAGKQQAYHPLAPEQDAVAAEIAVRVRSR